jgi:hypothetical protein
MGKYATEGRRLRQLRGDRHLADVGRHVGRGGQAIAHYESGRTAVPRDVAFALDELYDTAGEIAQLYGYAQRGAVTLEEVNAKLDILAGSIADGVAALRTALRLLHRMEARQRRAFDLMSLDPTVDLDDSRLDDPEYRATLPSSGGSPAGLTGPAATRPKGRRHRQGA